MPNTHEVEFWFSIGSTYTYLTVSRLHQVEAARGVRFRWRPFSLRSITQEMNNVPFATKPTKLAYMWRDVERRASIYGLPIKVPAPYPLKEFDLAIVSQSSAKPKGGAPTTFARRIDVGLSRARSLAASRMFRRASLRSGRPRPASSPLVRSDAIGQAYSVATEEARRLNIFGAPTFVTRGELFWGDDRLDDAVTWHARGKVVPPA